MKVSDIKGLNERQLTKISKEKNELLLYSSIKNCFVLFNASPKKKLEYYNESVYKGITENNNITNIYISRYNTSIKKNAFPFTTFIYFNDEITNLEDKKYLKKKIQKIKTIIVQNKNYREIMQIKEK